MINVAVMGPRGGKLDLHLHGFVMSAVKEYGRFLKIDRFKSNLIVKVHHQYVMNDEGAEGYCNRLEVGRNNFLIEVCLYGNWLSTLAHEMVHMKQYLRKEINDNLTVWKGRDFTDCDYANQPWELEANRLQHKMVGEFMGLK